MTVTKKVLGQIVLRFLEDVEPEVDFTGKLEMQNIQSAVYTLRTQFSVKYLEPLGRELERKAAEAALARKKIEEKLAEKIQEVTVPIAAKTEPPATAPAVATTESAKV